MKSVKKIVRVVVFSLMVLLLMPCIMPATQVYQKAEAASIKINKKKVTLNVNESLSLKVTGIKEKVIWSSSKKSVAVVDSKGKVTARKEGSVTITANINNKKYTCKIKVENPILNTQQLKLYTGDEYQLSITGTKGKVKWSSQKPMIASVDSNGKILANKSGITQIIAQIGNKKIICRIQVMDIEIIGSSKYLSINEICKLSLSNNSNNVIWESDNPNIASISTDGTVTGRSVGKVVIKAIIGNRSIETEIYVENPILSSTYIEVRKGELSSLSISGTSQIIKWTSQNTSIASVSGTGIIRGISEGTTKITGIIGNKEYACTVVVTKSKQDLISEENDRHSKALQQCKADAQVFTEQCNAKIRTIENNITPYYGSQTEYNNESAALLRTISNYTKSLNVLEGDKSQETQKTIRELKASLADAQAKYDNLVARFAAKQQIDQFKNLAASYESDKIKEENDLHTSNLARINA